MRKRIEIILDKLDQLDEKIESSKLRLSTNIEPPEAREIVVRECNDLMKKKVLAMDELIDSIDLLELRLKNI